ncbi:hypothetical protein SNOG_02106 [Parastagonospora nodorum SN15]|uniref:Uncharacterized protein n=1 Tax=Phaeosphaeria nodorum (strain SN15 / ATCC MYA-4574 / FGSC 10173) TaxID=321614 RepID=Q0V1K8_PHANO|nr:hypothetical protein SNOG_02106 [Parastagonospora nodorum SN15]EAT90318.1 hypothetical protein SNOG_02106 [Parastagonospora nodorum SN15]
MDFDIACSRKAGTVDSLVARIGLERRSPNTLSAVRWFGGTIGNAPATNELSKMSRLKPGFVRRNQDPPNPPRGLVL